MNVLLQTAKAGFKLSNHKNIYFDQFPTNSVQCVHPEVSSVAGPAAVQELPSDGHSYSQRLYSVFALDYLYHNGVQHGRRV